MSIFFCNFVPIKEVVKVLIISTFHVKHDKY